MFAARHITYNETNAFSKIVIDYLDGAANLQSFFSQPPTMEGLQQAIQKKSSQKIDRETLVTVLKEQYRGVDSELVHRNIESLLSPQTFTVCTAHQPNLFTGPLYFIYKILHAIKLAEHLTTTYSSFKFVPVFYMGSEDADLAELNHFTVGGKRYEWSTKQTGAVGRMTIDDSLIQLIKEFQQRLGVEPHGFEWIELLQGCYQQGKTIQQATFELVNKLFGKFGLVVLIADDARLKAQLHSVFEEDLFHHTASRIVETSCKRLSEHYNVQATPRAVNLFYLNNDVRERIERVGDRFTVVNTNSSFSETELREELAAHPERFSPNVILRGLYQETILPNVAFIGGGGEVAYWLQLKDLFQHYDIPFPVLVLRNSMLIVQTTEQTLIKKLQLSTAQLFQSKLELLNAIIEQDGNKPQLDDETQSLVHLYESLKTKAEKTDPTLAQHVLALEKRALSQLGKLEKKMWRAERAKLDARGRQLDKLKESLFPKSGLQERVENIGAYYAKWGSAFIDELYKHSLPVEPKFTVLTEGL